MAGRGARPVVRLVALLGVMALLLGGIVVRLVHLQVVKAERFDFLAAEQRVRRIDLPARRGPILDRAGRPLAVSVAARAVYANPRFVDDPAAAAAAIGPLLGVDEPVLRSRLERDAGFVYLARQVDPGVAERVLALGVPGVGALEESRRAYPGGALAGHVLGFVGTDHVGLAGLEAQWDEVLSGVPGYEIVEQDPRGRPIPQGRHQLEPPVPGRGIVLTIDRDIQFTVERVLAETIERTKARSASAVVLDPRTGDVLAMANWPPFDPSRFREVPPERWRNRAVTDVYEPGSVNKIVTAAAALEGRVLSPSQVFEVPDRFRIANKTFTDYEPHPTWRITLADVLARSSNVGTIKTALAVGERRLYEMLRRFGFGEPAGVGFPGEGAGLLLPLGEWYRTSIGTIPIGQGVAVTPLQMATVYAAIANDGVMVRPRLVRATVDRDGERSPLERPDRQRVVRASTAAQLRAMLVGVVEEGTGRRARISGYAIGGKTGTAFKPRTDGRGYTRDIITTFVGMVPAEQPRLVGLVTLDRPTPRFAALTAAPAFRAVMQESLVRLGIAPTLPTDREIASRKAAPVAGDAPPRAARGP